MDERLSISQLAERDAPALMMTEKLVINLRACTLFATTRRASRVHLAGSGKGFASEMTLISNTGLDALIDAFKFLNTMKLNADAMVKKGGTLERLQSTFGKPAERRSHERLMQRLRQEIGTCKLGSTELEEKLKSWRTEVEKFQTVVSKTNEHTVSKSEEKDNDIARQGAAIESATKLLDQVEEEGAEAKFKYDTSQENQQRIMDKIDLPERLNRKTLFDMAYSAIRIGWNTYNSSVVAQDVKKTQEELERRRQSAEDYKNQIEEAEIELQNLTRQSRQLEDFSKVLTPTLGALVSLTDNLRALVLGFSAVEPLMNMLLSRHAETHVISQDARDESASLSDIRDFTDNAKQMSEWALTIKHVSWLYASVIENVLIGGLEHVQQAASDHADGSVDTFDFFHASQRQQLYLMGTGSSCDVIRNEVDAKYEQERDAMEMRYEVERAHLAEKERQARKQLKKQIEREAGSSKLKFFSRR